MKVWVCLAVLFYMVGLGTISYAIEGFSGSTWGRVYHDISGDETFTIGNITQGIDWLDYKGLRLTTFSEFRYRFLTPDGKSFDAYGPSLGISVKKWGVELGAEYLWSYRRDTKGIEEQPRVFIEWYHGWDLEKLFR